jgi:hypothetical protein
MTSIVDLLNRTVGTGEVITITYNGGSRPGQARKVVPISLTNEELIAVEPGSHTNKHYKLNRIALVELSSGQRALNSEAAPPVISAIPTLETLTEYIERFGPEFQAAGWHICQSETSFAIATHFKNGKPRKTPSVSVEYFDPGIETIVDMHSGELTQVMKDLTGRERPWRVDSWRFKQGKSFAQLHRAFELFIEEARASDPATAKVLFSSN